MARLPLSLLFPNTAPGSRMGPSGGERSRGAPHPEKPGWLFSNMNSERPVTEDLMAVGVHVQLHTHTHRHAYLSCALVHQHPHPSPSMPALPPEQGPQRERHGCLSSPALLVASWLTLDRLRITGSLQGLTCPGRQTWDCSALSSLFPMDSRS